jgi:hypothetical protein
VLELQGQDMELQALGVQKVRQSEFKEEPNLLTKRLKKFKKI